VRLRFALLGLSTLVGACHPKPRPADVASAVEGGDDDRLSSLLDRGGDPNGVDPGADHPGLTLVQTAVALGDDRALSLLLSHGADPNRRNSGLGANTPLGMAALDGNAHAIPILVAAGARVDGDGEEEPPSSLAAERGQADALEALLVAGAKPDGQGADGTDDPPLPAAAGAGCIPCVQQLLKAGARIDRRDALGLTALNWATANDNAALVKLLLAAKADPLAANRAGWTPAFTAQYHNRADVLALYQAAGVTDYDMHPPPPLPPSGAQVVVPVVNASASGP
jgi:ankyrin repeat protein